MSARLLFMLFVLLRIVVFYDYMNNMAYKTQQLLTLRKDLGLPRFPCEVRGANRFIFCCVLRIFGLFVFVLCPVCPILSMPRHCPFVIVLSFFSDVYLIINSSICFFFFLFVTIYYLSLEEHHSFIFVE